MNNFIPGNSFADTQPSVSNMGSLPSMNTQVIKAREIYHQKIDRFNIF